MFLHFGRCLQIVKAGPSEHKRIVAPHHPRVEWLLQDFGPIRQVKIVPDKLDAPIWHFYRPYLLHRAGACTGYHPRFRWSRRNTEIAAHTYTEKPNCICFCQFAGAAPQGRVLASRAEGERTAIAAMATSPSWCLYFRRSL